MDPFLTMTSTVVAVEVRNGDVDPFTGPSNPFAPTEPRLCGPIEE